MELSFSARFVKSYAEAPLDVQKAFDKQGGFLLLNLRHPSLRAKKYSESANLWQARVTRDWRFYFSIQGNEYRLHDIKRHPK